MWGKGSSTWTSKVHKIMAHIPCGLGIKGLYFGYFGGPGKACLRFRLAAIIGFKAQQKNRGFILKDR